MIVNKLKRRFSGQFTRNVGWLGSSELVLRVFRLGTTVTLARMFTPHDYGLVAIIYTINNFAEAFSLKAGIGAKIVQAEAEELDSICETGYWLNWIFCLTIFFAQCALAYPIAMFYNESELIFPICALGLIYLMLPMFMVQSALIQRENRLKVRAMCTAAQAIVNNVGIVILALLGFGVWAIVLSLVISTPVWIIISYRYHSWRPSGKFSLGKWREVAGFGGSMVGIELLDKMRLNLDYLIVGRFLSVDALGIYFFAFSAGLGISKSIVNAVIAALFPHLCEVRDNVQLLKKRYFGSFKTIASIIIPLVILQSSLAPLYVPIVFGSKWVSAIPILIVICLSAIPLAFTSATYQLLNAVGQIKLTLQWNVIYTVIFAIALLSVVRLGVMPVAITVLCCQGLTLLFSYWATKKVLKQ